MRTPILIDGRWVFEQEDIVVILSDNIFQDSIRDDVRSFIEGGRIFSKEVPDTNRFGVSELDGDRAVGIEEKPEVPWTMRLRGCICMTLMCSK